MKIVTEYTLFFLESSRNATSGGQIVLERNPGVIPNMPAAFPSEQALLDWLKANFKGSLGAGSFVILPVHRFEY